MNYQYGIVRWNVSSHFHTEYYGPNVVGSGFTWSGEAHHPPSSLFYKLKDQRDVALKDLCKAYPGVMFCPVEITTGYECPPGELMGVSVSQKGVLPL